MSPEPRHPSRDVCPGNNRNSGYIRGKFVPCSSLARACINTRKARRSVAAARSVECCSREVDFRVFDGIRGLSNNGDNARRGAGLLECEDAAFSRADRQEGRGRPLDSQ